MSSQPSTLLAASQDRKARLAQLRSTGLKRKHEEQSNQPEEPHEASHQDTGLAMPRQDCSTSADEQNSLELAQQARTMLDVKEKYLSGRNFDHATGDAKRGPEHAPDKSQNTIERQAESLSKAVRKQITQEESKEEALDLFKLQPKNPNWDLKRDLGQRTQILDVRTDNAIARLVKQRIQSQSSKSSNGTSTGLEGADLVEAMRVREKEDEQDEQREKEWEQTLADTAP